jgi:hypothetical protein
MKNDQTALIVFLVVITTLISFGGFGMMGFGHMGGYGFSGMCSRVGGIWCYWPSGSWAFGLITWILATVVLILLIVWLVKQIKKPHNGIS